MIIQEATESDIDELLQLYFRVYGNSYPLEIGTDRNVMRSYINNENVLWLVSRDQSDSLITGSCVIECDSEYSIGKLSGVVVHPDYRKKNIANKLIAVGTEKLLTGPQALNSIYTTTRTISKGPQLMCLRNGFIPLGIFPNAHKLERYETLTLMAKYRDGYLEKREPLPYISEKLFPIASIVTQIIGSKENLRVNQRKTLPLINRKIKQHFEIIYAPEFVFKRFNEKFSDPYDRFYPFNKPNMLISATNNSAEIYAFYSKSDQHCAIIAMDSNINVFRDVLGSLLSALEDYGISYVETLIDISFNESIETLLEHRFLPSALYPAMAEKDNKLMDFVVLSRSMEPLDFNGMSIDHEFKPFLDQYISLWKQMYLDVLEVFDESAK